MQKKDVYQSQRTRMQRKQARARCVVNVVTVVLLAAILIIMNRLAA